MNDHLYFVFVVLFSFFYQSSLTQLLLLMIGFICQPTELREPMVTTLFPWRANRNKVFDIAKCFSSFVKLPKLLCIKPNKSPIKRINDPGTDPS